MKIFLYTSGANGNWTVYRIVAENKEKARQLFEKTMWKMPPWQTDPLEEIDISIPSVEAVASNDN